KATPWQPPDKEQLPSNDIYSLLAARDGALWIGTSKGLARWKDGLLKLYPELSGRFVLRLLEDREGTLWASGTAVPGGLLCEIRQGDVRCHGKDGTFGYGVFSLFEDRRGNLWLGVEHGVWRWRPQPAVFYPMPAEWEGSGGLADDRDGALLVATTDGIS